MQVALGRVMESVTGRAHGKTEAHDRIAVNPSEPSPGASRHALDQERDDLGLLREWQLVYTGPISLGIIYESDI